MAIVVKLTKEQHDTLVRVMTNKANEICSWQEALINGVRDEEYKRIICALDAIKIAKEEK